MERLRHRVFGGSFLADEPITEKAIQSQFSSVKKQATALLTTMMRLRDAIIGALHLAIHQEGETPSMIPPAMKDLYPRRPTLGEIETYLQRLIDAASLAKIPGNAKQHKGPDRKLDALEIAKAAARDFYSLTGKYPTASQRVEENGFRDFLSAIFRALDMSHNSAERFARDVRDWWKKDRQREDYETFQALIHRG